MRKSASVTAADVFKNVVKHEFIWEGKSLMLLYSALHAVMGTPYVCFYLVLFWLIDSPPAFVCTSHLPIISVYILQWCDYLVFLFFNAQQCDSLYHKSRPFFRLYFLHHSSLLASRCPPFLHPATLSTLGLSVCLPNAVYCAAMFCLWFVSCVCVSLCVTGSCRKLGWLTLMATRCLTLRYSRTHALCAHTQKHWL